jgi:hypothetical protein
LKDQLHLYKIQFDVVDLSTFLKKIRCVLELF